MKATDLKGGDVVPYKNTRSRVVYARITGIKNDEGFGIKPWFYGVNIVNTSAVYYSCTCSADLINQGHEYKLPTS